MTVSYDGNGQTNAGTYTIIAKFTGNKNYNAIEDMKATLVINKAKYDMSGVTYAGTETTYDGQAHSIVAENLPAGVTASYEGNDKVEAGDYTVVVSFTGDADNYELIPSQEVALKINKASYDMSKVTFEGNTVTYDGNVHELSING